MHHIREGFKGQRLITISPEILLNSQDNLLTKSLFVKKIGYNPQLKFHYIKKEHEDKQMINIVFMFLKN